MLFVVTDEVSELLFAAFQRGVELLHLIHQLRFLQLQPLTIRLHCYREREKEINGERHKSIKREKEIQREEREKEKERCVGRQRQRGNQRYEKRETERARERGGT